MISDFKGKTAVLTGAASGFGLECARLAAARGMHLVLVDVQADALAKVQAELQSTSIDIMAKVVDVANVDQMAQLADEVKARFGAPHWVFNNAGVASGGLVWEHSVADWQWVLGVNVWGVVHGVRLFTPMMLAAAKRDPHWRGHIVNTASMAGLVNAPNMGVYNVSKHAVVSLSETLYQDLRLITDQVHAHVLCPFFVPTGISHSERNRPGHLAAATPTRSQMIGQAMSEKAVSSGKMSAARVAQLVFDSIQTKQFYIYSHPHALGPVQTRLEDIVQARNPSDPFAHKPELGQALRSSLRGLD